MRTTTESAEVGRALTKVTLDGRDVLPRTANGRPIAPADPYAAQVRKEMGTGRSQEWKRLAAVSTCDLRDGVPLDLVTAPYRRMIAHLEAEAAYCLAHPDRPHGVLLAVETSRQSALDIRQQRWVVSPTDPNVIIDMLHHADRYTSALIQLNRAAERTLMQHAAVPLYGRRVRVMS